MALSAVSAVLLLTFSTVTDRLPAEVFLLHLAFDDLAAATAAQGPRVLVAPGAGARDGVAYKLLTLGYSARETADVVSGRISKTALDTARKMLMIGRGRDRAADYLDSQYKRVIALRTPPAAPPLAVGVGPFDAAIQKYALLHRVDAAVVRAVIAVESAFDPRALTRRRYRPDAAHAGDGSRTRVDPFVPEQNIEGGVRYLSELLEMFGGIELALVAYNGGSGFAGRYARGQTALYGETRDYVKQVMARVPRAALTCTHGVNNSVGR